MKTKTQHIPIKRLATCATLAVACAGACAIATPATTQAYADTLTDQTTLTSRATNTLINDAQNTNTKTPENSLAGYVGSDIVYRLYNTETSEHLFTKDKSEYDALSQEVAIAGAGWTGEGTAWYSPKISTVGVYRLYNPALGSQNKMSHHYTTNKQEAETLVTSQGWQYDNDGDPIFYSAVDANGNPITGAQATYRLYNDGLSAHHYTMDTSENDGLIANQGWAGEGIDWYSCTDAPSASNVDGTNDEEVTWATLADLESATLEYTSIVYDGTQKRPKVYIDGFKENTDYDEDGGVNTTSYINDNGDFVNKWEVKSPADYSEYIKHELNNDFFVLYATHSDVGTYTVFIVSTHSIGGKEVKGFYSWDIVNGYDYSSIKEHLDEIGATYTTKTFEITPATLPNDTQVNIPDYGVDWSEYVKATSGGTICGTDMKTLRACVGDTLSDVSFPKNYQDGNPNITDNDSYIYDGYAGMIGKFTWDNPNQTFTESGLTYATATFTPYRDIFSVEPDPNYNPITNIKIPIDVYEPYWLASASESFDMNGDGHNFDRDAKTSTMTYGSFEQYKQDKYYKSSAQIQEDIKKIQAGDSATIAEYTNYMNNQNVHLYTRWLGQDWDYGGNFGGHINNPEDSDPSLTYAEFAIICVGEHIDTTWGTGSDGSTLTFNQIHAHPRMYLPYDETTGRSLRDNMQKGGDMYNSYPKAFTDDIKITRQPANNNIRDVSSYAFTNDSFFIGIDPFGFDIYHNYSDTYNYATCEHRNTRAGNWSETGCIAMSGGDYARTSRSWFLISDEGESEQTLYWQLNYTTVYPKFCF